MKKQSLKTLKNKLDAVFSIWIRKRDGDSKGWGKCITCGKHCLLQASHFISRRHLSVRWDKRNVHGACANCNLWLHGNLINYTLFMQKTYGQDVVDELMRLKRTTVKFTRDDYTRMIEEFS